MDKDHIDNFFGKQVIISGEVIPKEGKKFSEYSLEEHLKYLGFSISNDELDDLIQEI